MHPAPFSKDLLNLVAIFILSTVSWAFSLAFIDPSYRSLRISILLISASIVARLQYDNPDFTGDYTYNGFILSLAWVLLLRAFDILLWTAGGIHMNSQTIALLQRAPSRTPTAISRLFISWCFIFNLRNINTPWVIKNIPNLPSSNVANAGNFAKSRITQVLVTYLSLDAIFTFLPPVNPDLDVPIYKQYILSRINDISIEEALARPFTIIVPAFCIYGLLTIPYNLASIIAVLCYGDEPQNWPPLFGSFNDAYTLRRFWGMAWHQVFRSVFDASASFISTYVLCISPQQHRLISSFLRLYLTFYISALLHIPGGIALGISPFATGCPKFFLMQAVGITIEGVFIHSKRALIKSRDVDRVPDRDPARLFGYLWTAVWLIWTAPEFCWATARRITPGRDDVVPATWSFFRWLELDKF